LFSQLHLTQEKLATVKMLLPLVDEQLRVIKVFNSIDEKINTESDSVQKLIDQKNGLMHDLLTGKVQVTINAAGNTHGS
jgi:type I restriction enzyme S subunit